MKVGNTVQYADEGTKKDALSGVVVEPTEEELAACTKSGDAIGPEWGDVMIAWNDGCRYWEHPGDLVVIEP